MFFGVSGNIKTKVMLDVESKRGYWLTVYAQDHGVVPLSSSLQVCAMRKINYMFNVLYCPEKYLRVSKFLIVHTQTVKMGTGREYIATTINVDIFPK